jgi:phage protein D
MPVPFLSIKLEGQKDDLAPLASSVRLEDNDRLVDEARMVFKDPDGKGAELFTNGRTLTIELGWDDEHAILFEGLVVENRPEAGAAGTRSVTVVARDLSHRMSLKVPEKPERHPAGTLQAIVERIAARNDWTGDKAKIVCDPNPRLTEQNDLMQGSKSEYQYLQELAERYGARAFVEYNDKSSRFYFISNRKLLEGKALGTLKYCRGIEKLIEFKYQSVAARSLRQVVASAVDPVTGEVKTAQGEKPAPAADGSTLASAVPGPTLAPGQPSDPERAARVVVFDPTRVLGLSGEGRAVGTIMLRAKGKVEITGIAPWAAGDWYVSKATHVWTDQSTAKVKRSSYETKFTATR